MIHNALHAAAALLLAGSARERRSVLSFALAHDASAAGAPMRRRRFVDRAATLTSSDGDLFLRAERQGNRLPAFAGRHEDVHLWRQALARRALVVALLALRDGDKQAAMLWVRVAWCHDPLTAERVDLVPDFRSAEAPDAVRP